MNKEFTLLYNGLQFSFVYELSNELNYNNFKNTIIKHLNLTIPKDEEITFNYIDEKNKEDKIEISNDEDLNQIFNFHNLHFPQNNNIPLEVLILPRDSLNTIDNEKRNIYKEKAIMIMIIMKIII